MQGIAGFIANKLEFLYGPLRYSYVELSRVLSFNDKDLKSATTFDDDIEMFKSISSYAIDEIAKHEIDFTFVYLPTVPIIDSNEVIVTDDSDTIEFMNFIRSEIESNGMDFIDMTDSFVKLYEEEKKLPRGFNNTMIGTGHLNRDGHRVIAEKILEYLKLKGMEVDDEI